MVASRLQSILILTIISNLPLSQSHHHNDTTSSSPINDKSTVFCDGINNHCINNTITCPSDQPCNIYCNPPSNLNGIHPDDHEPSISSQCIENTFGCCNTHIQCPIDNKCTISCAGDCSGLMVHAQDSSLLEINKCFDPPHQDITTSTCNNMDIVCPDTGPCRFGGDYKIEDTDLHSIYGFTYFHMNDTLDMEDCTMFCGDLYEHELCEGIECDNSILRDMTRNESIKVCNQASVYNVEDAKFDAMDISNYGNDSEEAPPPSFDAHTTLPRINITKHEGNNTGEENPSYDKTMTAWWDPSNKWQMLGYIIVFLLLLIPIIVIIVALIYHRRRRGSDTPEYISILKCFINIADLYTDIIFCIMLYSINNEPKLYIPAIVFTTLPHVTSIVMGMYHIHQWRKQRLPYIKRYDNLVISMTVLAGFVPTVEALSSKLFYASRFTLQLNDTERMKIQQFRFLNNNLFENIPLMAIQILTVRASAEAGPVTLMAFAFSSLSAAVGILTLISRCMGNKCGLHKSRHSYGKLTYKVDVKSASIDSRHHYCHRLFAKSLCQCMETNEGRIETMSIIPIVDGLSCTIQVSVEEVENDDIQLQAINDIDGLLTELMDQSCETFRDFKTSLCKNLYINTNCNDLMVMVTKLDSTIPIDDVHNASKLNNLNSSRKRNSVPYMPLKQASVMSTTSKSSKSRSTKSDDNSSNRLSISSSGGTLSGETKPLKYKYINIPSKSNSNSNSKSISRARSDKSSSKYSHGYHPVMTNSNTNTNSRSWHNPAFTVIEPSARTSSNPLYERKINIDPSKAFTQSHHKSSVESNASIELTGDKLQSQGPQLDEVGYIINDRPSNHGHDYQVIHSQHIANDFDMDEDDDEEAGSRILNKNPLFRILNKNRNDTPETHDTTLARTDSHETGDFTPDPDPNPNHNHHPNANAIHHNHMHPNSNHHNHIHLNPHIYHAQNMNMNVNMNNNISTDTYQTDEEYNTDIDEDEEELSSKDYQQLKEDIDGVSNDDDEHTNTTTKVQKMNSYQKLKEDIDGLSETDSDMHFTNFTYNGDYDPAKRNNIHNNHNQNIMNKYDEW